MSIIDDPEDCLECGRNGLPVAGPGAGAGGAGWLPLLYVTFGQKYHREPHPRLPGWACDPDGWLEVVADTKDSATALLIEHVGVLAPGVVECAGIYEEWTSADRGYYPKGCLGTISKDGLTRGDSDG